MRRLLQIIRFVRVALAARTIQDYLWGGAPGERKGQTMEAWLAAAQKRLDRIIALDRSNPSWRIEARKRLLQLATISVSMMEWLDAGEPSTLPARNEEMTTFTGADWPSPWYPRN